MAGRKPRARYLQVKGWWDFQHYPDKVEAGWQPPWIKVYTALLDDPEYNQMSEVDRGRLHRLWLLAARLDNKIPWDDKYVRVAIRAGNTFRLSTFIHSGMLQEWTPNAAVRPPRKTKKPPVQAESRLDVVYTTSRPEQEQKKKEKRQRPLDQVGDQPASADLEKDQELGRIKDRLRDADDRTMDVLRDAARGVPFSSVAQIRHGISRKPMRSVGVGYAIKALRSEAEAA